MGKRNSAAAAAKLTAAEAKVALAVRKACTATAHATHAARVAKATGAAAALAARVHVPTKARPYVAPVDVSAAREVVRLARAASLCAVKAMRAIRMADAHIAAVKARATKAPAISVPTTVVEVHTVQEEAFASWHRAFLAQVHAYIPVVTKALKGPTVGLSLEQKVAYKAMRLGARRGATKAPTPRARLNAAEVRAAITERDHQRYLGRIAALEALAAEEAALSAAEKAEAIALAKVAHLALLSEATKAFRIAQGAEQREYNAMLKAHNARKAAHKEIKALERSIMGVTPVVQVRVVRPIVAKLQGAHATDMARRHVVVDKKAFYPEAAGFRTSPLHPVMAPKTAANAAKREAAKKAAALVAARKAAKKMSRQEWELQKAHRLALKEQYMALRAAKVNRICTEVWYKHGIWVDTFLVRACNDSDHNTRVAAMTELLALRGVAA